MQSRILSVGRLVPRKGHSYLIEAVKKLVAEGLDIKLVIIGFGPEKGRLQELATGLDCDIRSGVSEEEVNEEYRRAEVFVLPSVTDSQGEKEGLGLVLLEAISYNVPVVAYNNGGIAEVVINGQTGLLVPEKDIDGLAAAIKLILGDDELRRQLTSQAVEFCKENFSTGVLVQQQSEIYREILTAQVAANHG